MASDSGLIRYPVEIKATDHLQMQVITVMSQDDSVGSGAALHAAATVTIAQMKPKKSA
jgi:hypothetical protein